MIQKLLAACEAYHDALDQAFAMLIGSSYSNPKMEEFFPSRSAMWPAMRDGHAVLHAVKAELNARGAP
jgi:hypothetical protein